MSGIGWIVDPFMRLNGLAQVGIVVALVLVAITAILLWDDRCMTESRLREIAGEE